MTNTPPLSDTLSQQDDAPLGHGITEKIVNGAGFAASAAGGLTVAAVGSIWTAALPIMAADVAFHGANMTSLFASRIGSLDALSVGVAGTAAGAALFLASKRLLLNATRPLLSKEFWQKAEGSGWGQKALAITDKLKGLHSAVALGATSMMVTSGLAVGGLMGASADQILMATGAAGAAMAAGTSVLDRLRAERELRRAEKDPSIKAPSKNSYPINPF